ncbi:ABC transporter substrate-binding protein [Deinococcus sp.]|uniref:ABC transporter substrate-binding protein n=1 Tax=Deinococcus sp. TaxID=47478 RepID=UPI003B5B2C6A
MPVSVKALTSVVATALLLGSAQAVTITIATVDNGDMLVMQKLVPEFNKKYPNIQVKWVTLSETDLRQQVTLDVASGAGKYDVATVGSYEVPIWAKNGWLNPLTPMFAKNTAVASSYNVNDLIPGVRKALTYNSSLYAVPFYAESSMTYYNKAMFAKAGITMPQNPTWEQIRSFAAKTHDPKNGVYGICLRGLPGWGANMALFSTMVNTYGGRWYNNDWKAQLNTPAWKDALNMYVDLAKNYGPPDAATNNFNENLRYMRQAKCSMWIDATVAAGRLSDPANSVISKTVGFANAPVGPSTPKGSNWFWSWNLAIPKSTKQSDAAFKFVTWATSTDYIASVAKLKGTWTGVPSGTRTSTYNNPLYKKAAGAFSGLVIDSINRADVNNATKDPVPYSGVQYVAIPEFQAMGTLIGQYVNSALTGKATVEQALIKAQSVAQKVAQDGGYQK